jgi:excinuclease ABC A subunit
MYDGSYAGLLKSDTLTGRHLSQDLPLKTDVRTATGKLPIRNANTNNLQDVSVDIPTGVLTVVTGVAGSGKSSLINQEFLRQHPDAVVVDQSAVGVSTRSNPATYTGVMDEVRKAFAAANKVNAGLFSFNSKGACEKCQGLGVLYQDMGFLEGIKLPCDVCEGHRFKDEVLAYKLGGKSIAEVLNMRVSEALKFFTGQNMPATVKILQAMVDVGLTYLTLGQPLSTLSGGECQRIKLAGQLHKKGSVYVMDEPTTGLHRSDTGHLVTIMNRLVDEGNTVVVIEHNTDIMRNADWIIDMGPEGGNRGGRVLFEGIPHDLKSCKESLTAEYV